MKDEGSIQNHSNNPSQIIFECGDANRVLKKYSTKFDLIITSPPYNIGKEYEDKKEICEYLKQQRRIIKKLVEMLSEEGSICWQVGNYDNKENKEIFPLDIFYYDIFKKNKLFLKNRIIWHFGHGLHAATRFSGRYETILWFTKSPDKYIFNLDDVRIRSKYPAKRHFKGPNKGKLSGNPKGKNPSDVWKVLSDDWSNGIWEIPNVKANHPEKTSHPCQYPIELVERCILALTSESSWILDPYAGVGSTLLAAYKTGRNALGIELCEEYHRIGLERLEELRNDKLKFRPIEQPIYDHTKSKLSIFPEEFKK